MPLRICKTAYPVGYDGGMALILLGKTECMICRGVLQPGDDVRGFPAFISDKSDPLWEYSDGACHASCYEHWEHRQAFEAKYAEVVEKFKRMGPEDI